MFASGHNLESLSSCITCRYRLAMRQHVARRSSHVSSTPRSRQIHRASRLPQQQAQAHQISSHMEKIDRHVTDAEYQRALKHGERRVNLFKKDSLGMDSLGRPAEALILRGGDKEREPGLYVNFLKKLGHKNLPLSASQLLARIDAAKGIVGTHKVAENLEDVRSSWTAGLKTKEIPTKDEYCALAQTVRDGFTAKQLSEYYGKETLECTSNPDDLAKAYSDNLYTRSAWHIGTTSFPANSATRFGFIRRAAQQQYEAAGADDVRKVHQKPYGLINERWDSKSIITDKILRDRWQITSVEDEAVLGEIDIWPRLEYLRVLLNHNQDILQRLSQRYGAKIDASAEKSIIRITAERATSGDVLKFIIYMLGRMRQRDIEIPPVPHKRDKTVKVLSAKERLQNTTFRGQLQQATNTIIEPTAGLAEKGASTKVSIFFLGPSEEDVDDAERLLLQSVRPQARPVNVQYGASHGDRAIAPTPIEVGTGLPLAQRTGEYCRWSRSVERAGRSIEHKATRSPDLKTLREDEAILQKVLTGLEKHHSKKQESLEESQLEVPQSPHWLPKLELDHSVTIGRVVSPVEVAKDVKIAKLDAKRNRWSSILCESITSQHEFLCSSNGLQPSFRSGKNRKLSQREFLLVRLSPSVRSIKSTPSLSTDSKILPPTQTPLPELEIQLDINQDHQQLTPKQVRFVFNTRKSDILLPQQPSDLRFITEKFVNASTELDPRISTFIGSSNLNLWGSERLKTPSSLTLEVPYRYEGKQDDHVTQRQPLEYTFTALEHNTQLLCVQGDHQYKYTVIEAGRIGGQREEFCIKALCPTEKPMKALCDRACDWIRDMTSMTSQSQSFRRRSEDRHPVEAKSPRTRFRREDEDIIDQGPSSNISVRRVEAETNEEGWAALRRRYGDRFQKNIRDDLLGSYKRRLGRRRWDQDVIDESAGLGVRRIRSQLNQASKDAVRQRLERNDHIKRLKTGVPARSSWRLGRRERTEKVLRNDNERRVQGDDVGRGVLLSSRGMLGRRDHLRRSLRAGQATFPRQHPVSVVEGPY